MSRNGPSSRTRPPTATGLPATQGCHITATDHQQRADEVVSVRDASTSLKRVSASISLSHRRAVSMIATILVGVAILTESTAASGHIRNNSSPPPDDSLDQATPAPWAAPGVPAQFRSALEIANQSLYRHAPRPQMHRTLQNHAPSDRFTILTGVIAYTDPKQGFAIIGNSVDNTFLVRPGQQLPDGAWIREIHAKNVVLEHKGALETLGMYRHDESAGTAYAELYPLPQPPSPLPQQARWEAPEAPAAIETKPDEARATDTPPSPPGLSLSKRSETPASEARSSDAQPGATSANDGALKQARPESPPPAAQDPADELSDDRRQRAESRSR
jgi:Type II secretion system protein C